MTRRRWTIAVLVALTAATAGAANAQTDVAASVYGAFSGTVNGNGVTQSPSNQAGVLVELHHQSNPLLGYEVTYAWNRADQNYSGEVVCPGNPVPVCNVVGPANKFVPANAHEVTADYEVSAHILNLRPFLLAGGGILFNQPAGSQNGAQSQTKGVLVYGGGVDWAVMPHLGIRGQYRGNVYKAPQLATAYSSTGAFFHTAEPMLGAYFRF
jgi:opacity protein-like surface antigen